MKAKQLLLGVSIVLLYACQKNEDPVSSPGPDPIPINTFFPMSIGNYWVYEFVSKNPDGVIVGTPTYDTLKITKDTIIAYNTFYICSTNKPNSNTRFARRDSMGYIINPDGVIQIPPHATEMLYNFHYGYINGDTAFTYWEEFQEEFTVSTSVGTYECMGKLASHQLTDILGGNLVTDTIYYAPIGTIQRSYSFSSGGKMFGSIIDYNLEE